MPFFILQGTGRDKEVHVPGSLLGHCLEKLYTLLGNDPEQRVCNQIKFGAETLEHRRTYTEVHCQQGFSLDEIRRIFYRAVQRRAVSQYQQFIRITERRRQARAPLGLQQDFHYTEEALPKLFQPFQTFFSHIVIKVTSYSYEVQIPSTFRLPANNYSPYHVASFKRQIHNAYSVHLQHLQYIYVTPAIHFHNTCTVQIKHLCPVIILLNTYKQNLSPPITTQPLVARSL